MLPRFLADSLDSGAATARLAEDEARHLAQVLRLRAGDEVAVFDAVRLTLAQAAIKGEKMDDVIRDATMMGVVAIEPLVTAHTAAHLKPGGAPERWRRIAIASVKQSRRAVVPAIGSGLAFDDWLARDRAERRLILVEPCAEAAAQPLSVLAGPAPASASLLVGPEGGWSPDEIAAATGAGYAPVTLGRRTLRADAVPIIAIGVLQFLWGDL